MKRALALAALSFAACTTNLPEISPERFACDADTPFEDGTLQCPESHWCSSGACTPRLQCRDVNTGKAGCAPLDERCDLFSNGETAAAACRRGTHIVTSTVPIDPAGACTCADGTYCTILAKPYAGEAYPLYVLPRGTAPSALPTGRLGITGDDPVQRVCTRACATEADCPANHTCRAAAVVQASLQSEPPSSRGTIGVCYPDRLVATSTTVTVPQPDVQHCETQGDCLADKGRYAGSCQVGIVDVPDHPAAPAGSAAWGSRLALVARCVESMAGANPGVGCTASVECKSGVCLQTKCARLCDPREPVPCEGGQLCRDFEVEREIPGSNTRVVDHIYVCDRR